MNRRASLIERCKEKGFDVCKMHWFMVKHELAEAVILYPSFSESGLQEQKDRLKSEYNLRVEKAHIELDYTRHYE